MADSRWQHGKSTAITVAGDAITSWTNNSEMTRGATDHTVTPYGVDDEEHTGGLLNGKFTCSGVYDNTEGTGPGSVLDPIVGEVVEVTRAGEGMGTGKPMQTFDALCTSYVETNPVADMVTWAAEFTVSGPVVKTAQA